MNHNQLVAEGNRLSAALEFQTRIIKDPSTLPEQARIIAATGILHARRLEKIAELMESDCQCGHAKTDHLNGMSRCLVKVAKDDTCLCAAWDVEA